MIKGLLSFQGPLNCIKVTSQNGFFYQYLDQMQQKTMCKRFCVVMFKKLEHEPKDYRYRLEMEKDL